MVRPLTAFHTAAHTEVSVLLRQTLGGVPLILIHHTTCPIHTLPAFLLLQSTGTVSRRQDVNCVLIQEEDAQLALACTRESRSPVRRVPFGV